jgi:hypothetical protein
MGKIFEFIPGKSSDNLNGKVFTINNVEYARTEKGLALSVRKSSTNPRLALDSYVNCGIVHSIVIPFKQNIISSHSMLLGYSSSNQYYISTRDDNRVYVNVGGYGLYGNFTVDQEWHFLIVTRNGEEYEWYIDGKSFFTATMELQQTTVFAFDVIGNWYGYTLAMDGYIGKIQVYDHILATEERANLYKEFLQASPITKTIR